MNASGFPFLADRRSKILILGSFPSRSSLEAVEYYAHPRNVFWPILFALLENGSPPPKAYGERKAILKRRGIALWDVAESCRRPGSLDANIDAESVKLNRFEVLRAASPDLRAVFFNGKSVHGLYRKLTGGRSPFPPLPVFVLPSTSPANARLDFGRKLEAWREILDFL